jgi:hypothetical protein
MRVNARAALINRFMVFHLFTNTSRQHAVRNT